MLHWYIFQSKTRKEELLCEQLRLREIEIFYPTLHVRPVNPRSKKIRPYFPGYVFGRVDLDELGRSIVDWLPGAVGIVSFGGDPAQVPDELVTSLRQHLSRVNASNGKEIEKYQPGDVVAIRAGPFSGYEAIFDVRLPGRDRVEVLLKLLQGNQIRVELPAALISLKEESSKSRKPSTDK
jgi:transcriptional antiterminator RfaH